MLKLTTTQRSGSSSYDVTDSFNQKAQISSTKMTILHRHALELKDRIAQESTSFQNHCSATQKLSDTTVHEARSSSKLDTKDRKRTKCGDRQTLIEMAEVSRNRASFNGNKDKLPAIGQKVDGVDFYVGNLPAVQSKGTTAVSNDVIDVINRHETKVRSAAIMKEIGSEFINRSAIAVKSETKNNMAPEIIERLEGRVGRAYERYGGYPGYKYRKVNGVTEEITQRACSRAGSRTWSRSSNIDKNKFKKSN